MTEKPAKVIEKPVDWDELYPGRFLKASDFKGKKPTLAISHVRVEELIGDKGAQMKGVISFDRTEKQLALNKTNGICLKAMFGRKVQEWVGKRITLFATVYGDDECIRVWGSPDITDEFVVQVQLRRKRPFEMTMHKVTKDGEPAKPEQKRTESGNGTAVQAISVPDALKSLSVSTTPLLLEAMKNAVYHNFKLTDREVPLEVEAAYQDRKAALDQEAARG